VAKEKRKIWFTAGFLFFVIYFFAASRPIPPETILAPRWLSSLELDLPEERSTGPAGDQALPAPGGFPVPLGGSAGESAPETDAAADNLLPFVLGGRFGYVDTGGRFSINRIKKEEVYLSENLWSEYDAEPERIEIRNNRGEEKLVIEDPRGYPFFLDGRIFLLGSEQNTLSEIDISGAVLWTYEFAAPLTCVDAAAGLVLTGSVDGVVEMLDGEGKRVFYFEPGGSRYAVILGCAISRDGSSLGIISGIDDQRFLLLERFGGGNKEYKVSYHEFLEDGFRRPMHITFIDQDRWIVFERQGGIGLYELNSRRGTRVPLNGGITAIDKAGGQGLFFVVVSRTAAHKNLVGIRLPGRSVNNPRIVMEAPFKSGDAFLGRTGSRLFVGGGSTLISFELEKK
jgi:hypothetical protein